jgi:hypothetical protein
MGGKLSSGLAKTQGMEQGENKLVELKLGMVPNQRPYHSMAIILSGSFLLILFLDIHRNGFRHADYAQDMLVLGVLLVAYACWVFVIQGFRVVLDAECISTYLFYPLRIFGKSAPLGEITKIKKGRINRGRPMQAITVDWQDYNEWGRQLHIPLDNFPAREVQRLLDEVGKRRPDLKIPVVGKQATAISALRGS